MTAPFCGIDKFMHTAAGDREFFEVHSLFQFQVIDDPVIGIVMTIRLHGNSVCRQDDAVLCVTVADICPSGVL